jgi:calcineurin-like phosphoesterase
MHGEATSEKTAMGWHLDGRVSAVLGTHTHIPTADERVLHNGTAYITDVGMTGSFDSVIGIEKQSSIPRFLSAIPTRFEVAKVDPWFNAVTIDIDESTGLARAIERIRLTQDDLEGKSAHRS